MKFVLIFAILCVIAVAVDSYHRYKRDDRYCKIPGYCLPGRECIDNKCVRLRPPREKRQAFCKTSDDCLFGMPCIFGVCVPPEAKESRQQQICTTPADCKPGYRCIDRGCMIIKEG